LFSTTELLKPELIEKISSLNLRARLVVEGFISGLHRSPFRGFSLEFTEHRPYLPGDSIKLVDWKVYARTDRFFVKEFEEETNLRATVFLDVSNSMDFGKPVTKMRYAVTLAAAFFYLLIHQRDSAGLVAFSDRIEKYIPPSSGKEHLNTLLHTLSSLKPGRKTRIDEVVRKIAGTMKKRGLVIFISDLLYSPEQTLNAIRLLRTRKNEVIVFHILSPEEQEFPYKKATYFEDMETKRLLPVDPSAVKRDYKKLLERYLEKLRQGFVSSDIRYVFISTTTPYDTAMLMGVRR